MHIDSAPYIPTHRFDGEYINENHRYYSYCKKSGVCIDTGIDGWLHTGDALKIYELTYFSAGDILNMGTYKGLSASIILSAIKDSGKKLVCNSVDINVITTEEARDNLSDSTNELQEVINFYICDGVLFLDTMIMQNKKYGFAFIDAGHGYKNTYANAIRLNKLLISGGFVLFHDYIDRRNFDEESYYGVFQATNDALLVDNKFVFCGVFGCSALFRYVGM